GQRIRHHCRTHPYRRGHQGGVGTGAVSCRRRSSRSRRVARSATDRAGRPPSRRGATLRNVSHSAARLRPDDQQFDDGTKVARMYYHLGLTTTEIAKQLGVARPTISRLLSWARSSGLVEFRIVDHRERQLSLETRLEQAFEVDDVKIVPQHPDSSVLSRQQAVASFTAHLLNSLVAAGTCISLAWGTTISMLAAKLIPKPLPDVNVVQMNGSG